MLRGAIQIKVQRVAGQCQNQNIFDGGGGGLDFYDIWD